MISTSLETVEQRLQLVNWYPRHLPTLFVLQLTPDYEMATTPDQAERTTWSLTGIIDDASS
jgi:hypothetical protein